MEGILGELIGDLTTDLLSHDLTPEQERERVEQTYVAVASARRQQEELEANASHLVAHGDYILNRVRAAHEFSRRITDIDLKMYVKDYLSRVASGFGFQEDHDDSMTVKIRLPVDLAVRLESFITASRLHGQTRLATGEPMQCKFHNRVGRLTRTLETINQFHPLVRFISQDLKNRSETFYPLIAAKVDGQVCKDLKTGVYAIVAKRWTFQGLRTEEKLQARGLRLNGTNGEIDPEQALHLFNAIKVQGLDWLSAESEVNVDAIEEAFEKCDVQLQEDYESSKRSRNNENQDRVGFQRSNAIGHRDRLIDVQRELLDKYNAEGRSHLIPMTEGRIRAIERRYELQLEKLRQQEVIASSVSEVCYGVVEVRCSDL